MPLLEGFTQGNPSHSSLHGMKFTTLRTGNQTLHSSTNVGASPITPVELELEVAALSVAHLVLHVHYIADEAQLIGLNICLQYVAPFSKLKFNSL
jgi:hypothetical protein